MTKLQVQPNMLFTGDNLYVMHGMNSDSVDLIYLDPPFNSKRLYKAPIGSRAAGSSFKDMWTWGDVDEGYLEGLVDEYPQLVRFIQSIELIHGPAMMSYITYMTQRLLQMHRVLKPTGSLYLHVDSTAVHYLKIVLDAIFGKNNYRNDIVWQYGRTARGGKAVSRDFPRNHDVVLLYAKNRQWVKHNPVMAEKRYEIANLPSHIREEGGRFYKTAPRGNYTDASVAQLRREGRIHVTRNGNIRIKYFLEQVDGHVIEPGPVGNVWEIPDMMHTRKEYIGYPTQKPLQLLRRIISASTDDNDVVFDPFCGCATALVAAQHLNRRWVGIDISDKAVELVSERLADDAGLFTAFTHTSEFPVRTDVEIMHISDRNKKQIKQWLAKQFGAACRACGMDSYENLEIDHIIPKSRGGLDTRSNYQLLCGNCNRMKGSKPMDYLRKKIHQRQAMKQKVSFG